MNVFDWLGGHFSNRGKALTLYRRGMARMKKRDLQGAIDDYTSTIEIPDAPPDVKAMALYNRALAFTATKEDPKATEDIDAVLAMKGALPNVKTEARRLLVRMQRRSSHQQQVGIERSKREAEVILKSKKTSMTNHD